MLLRRRSLFHLYDFLPYCQYLTKKFRSQLNHAWSSLLFHQKQISIALILYRKTQRF